MLKVLHITKSDRGGAGLCCLRIHESLMGMGVDSKVVTLQSHLLSKEVYSFGRIEDNISKIPSKFFRILGLKVTDRNKILELIRTKGHAYSIPKSNINLLDCKWIEWADVIHLHSVSNYIDLPTFFKNIQKPVVWTLHDENFFFGIAHYSESILPDNPMEIKYYKVKEKSLANIKNLNVVMLSEYLYKKFRNHPFLNQREVRIINNPVDTKIFKPKPRHESREKLGLSDDDILIGFTSYIISDERKGLNILSRAVNKIGDSRIKILAIGSNPQNCNWPNVISVGLKNNNEEICEILSAANFFAMPSYQEAFAQSPMEAMACGLPVVVFPVSGTSELVNTQNGFICEDFTEGALQQGIRHIMAHSYNPFNIRQDMITRFSPNVISKKYIDLYKYAINNAKD